MFGLIIWGTKKTKKKKRNQDEMEVDQGQKGKGKGKKRKGYTEEEEARNKWAKRFEKVKNFHFHAKFPLSAKMSL